MEVIASVLRLGSVCRVFRSKPGFMPYRKILCNSWTFRHRLDQVWLTVTAVL